ncbi:MAG: 50S ribosomal protein L32 [Flavobacteriales bacterium]|nr:50S ribosomal protein L32 [Flavobacteriales bacterium]|tara:strand:- start:46 stop:234 length:189 start_codon:yes stop_codon:yes gene_type:complete
MAHPKRKISKTRRDKRRTHYKANASTVKLCPETGEAHLYHHAYEHAGDLYYKGKLVASNTTK